MKLRIRRTFLSVALGLLSALLIVNLTARAETRSLTTTSAAQSPLKFEAELSLDRGCGAVSDGSCKWGAKIR